MDRQKSNKWIIKLLILYIVLVIVRFVCAFYTTSFPIVGIDEFLYYSLGRSIATEGKLLFRGQTANYAYILYPMVLAPVYLIFNQGVHFYRLIQLWNIMVMTASVFPLFYLGRAMLKSEKKAFFFTAVSMLLPDFILGQLIFSEVVIYPLFFTLMYCAYAYYQGGRPGYLLWTGLIGGLLYSAKPGAVTPAAVFLMIVIFKAVRNKERDDLSFIIGAVIILAVTIAGFMLLARYGFGYQGAALSIYDEQMGDVYGLNLNRFFKALVLYPYYFILSCGIIGFVYPVFSYRGWTGEQKNFWWLLIASLAAMFIGSAWTVERIDPVVNLNIRYVAMYIPLIYLFCFVRGSAAGENDPDEEKELQSIFPVLILGFLVICTLLLGCKAGGETDNAYSLLPVSLLNNRFLPPSKQVIGDMIIIILCAALVPLFIKNNTKLDYGKICMVSIIIFMLINNVLGYVLNHKSYRLDYEEDGFEVSRQTKGIPYLYLLSKEGIADDGVDVNSKSNNFVVYVNDFISSLQNNNGVYTPYLPKISRGIAYAEETPDVDTLVVDYDSFSQLKFSENTAVSSPNGRRNIYIVHFEPGTRIVDSSVANVKSRVLSTGTPGILFLYDQDLLHKPLTVRMDIESEVAQTMTINSTRELYPVELSAGRAWYEVTFAEAEKGFNFIVQDHYINLYAYELISPEG